MQVNLISNQLHSLQDNYSGFNSLKYENKPTGKQKESENSEHTPMK